MSPIMDQYKKYFFFLKSSAEQPVVSITQLAFLLIILMGKLLSKSYL